MPVQLAQRLLNVEEYYKMAEASILTSEDQVELIRGQILQMSPIGSRHAACVDKIITAFHSLINPETAIVRGQNPVQLDPFSEPEPDIAVLKPEPDFYSKHHLLAKDILLIIEVADTSFEYDREVKKPLYAEAGIFEYWIVNLEKKEIEAYYKPSGKVYKHMNLYLSGDKAQFQGQDISIPATDLLV